MQEVRDSCSVPGLGRSPRAGNGNTLQDPWLENPMARGAWRARVHGVGKSWTRLSDWSHEQRSQKGLDEHTHVTKDLHTEHVESSYKSVIKRQINQFFKKDRKLKQILHKGRNQMTKQHLKRCSQYCSSENWKLKPQWVITVHPLERLQLKGLSLQVDVEQLELPSMANNVECWQLRIKGNVLLFYDPATPKRI